MLTTQRIARVARSALLLSVASATALLACSEPEEVCLTASCAQPEGGAGGGEDDAGPGGEGGEGGAGGAGGMGGQGGAGGQGGEGGQGGQGGMGGGGPVEPMPDRELFADGIAQMLNRRCSGAGCHPHEVDPDDDDYGAYPLNPVFTDEVIDGMMAEALDYVNFDDPAASELLTYGLNELPHPVTVFERGGADYRLVLDWIVDAITPEPEPEPMGGMGGEGGVGGEGGAGGAAGPDVCDGLPTGDPLGRPGYYEAFELRINPILVQRCTDGACHAVPQQGGGLWIDTEYCGVDWNFSAVHLFIDYRDTDASPLLTQPLSANHGGLQVFMGRADPGFVELRTWINSGLQ